VPSHREVGRSAVLRVALAVLVAAFSIGAHAVPAHAQVLPVVAPGVPNACDVPGFDLLCDAVRDAATEALGAAGEFVMRGLTVWVTNAAVWLTGKVGELIDATASPDVQATWFTGQYGSMLAVAAALALPMLLLAVIQALMRHDIWILLRSAFGYLPMAFVLAGTAVVGTDLLISITDDMSTMITSGLGEDSDNVLALVGEAYSRAIEDESGGAVPLFGVFLGALVLAIGAFVLWLEMVIRDAAIYIALFFAPLTFVAMIWPATSRYARRLVEFLIAVILAKFVVVAIIGLASAAITNAGAAAGEGKVFERMIAGAALLVLAAWSPFALLRLIPMMEVAAATVVAQRSSMSGAASSAGIHSPATYMRQAMDRYSRASTSPAYPGAAGTTYIRVAESASSERGEAKHETRTERHTTTGTRSSPPSGGPSGTIYTRPSGETPPAPRSASPPRSEPPPPRTEPRRATPPAEPPTDPRPRPPREDD